jgi:hypothetical protein
MCYDEHTVLPVRQMRSSFSRLDHLHMATKRYYTQISEQFIHSNRCCIPQMACIERLTFVFTNHSFFSSFPLPPSWVDNCE